MLSACGSQLRVGGMGMPFALDFGAVMAVAQARAVDIELLAELLPDAQRVILSSLSNEPEVDDGQ